MSNWRRRSGQPPRPQRGLALITAMLVVAIVATIAAYLSLGQEVWIRQTQNLADRSQADKVADGALLMVLQVLDNDAKKNNPTDDLTQDWAGTLPPMPVANGIVVVKIYDAQARFNLNNLWQNGAPSPQDIGVFQRLLQSLGLDPGLTDALIEWIDPRGQTRPNGAGDPYYLMLTPPYRAAHQPLQSVDELRLVRGFTAKTVEKLQPYVVALPMPTPININTTTSAVVLSALFNALSLQAAQGLIDQRDKDQNPFANKSELQARAGQAPVSDQTYDVKTSYFIADVQTSFGRLSRESRALISRPSGGQPPATIIWQSGVLAAQLPQNQGDQ